VGEYTALPPAVDVVDTTGAGDCFAGTLAPHHARGDAVGNRLAAAVTAGARATTWRGREFE
jgi:ribokinase